ncbi:transcriptional regulator family: Fungal Specific TF [Penicillium roqueforti]|nr:transcriptional regulator family: Fungal Specific TF [Penicillium roqueforti]KAI3096482.1 transcriptional regulator family: Fungal Specific TF [Penicillium roqueforti]KAI3193708.1 transcriptional regulator family: Fungal Specific TF [Penicillium roqueforti]
MQVGSAAPNACFLCHSQKRKCDRQIPGCSRCVSNNVPCQYTSCATQENPSHQPLQPITCTQDHDHWSLIIHKSLYYLDQPYIGTCRKKSIDIGFTSYMFDILASLNLRLENVIGCYERCMHQWLPFIHPIFLAQRVASLRDEPCAELASLILHILLVNPPNVPELSQLTEIIPLYVNSSVFEEERKRVWWSIYLLDRLFYHFDESSGRTLLVQSSQSGHELPVDDELWSNHTGVGPWDPEIKLLSDAMGTTIPGFAQQIEAVYFLEQVVQLTEIHPVSMMEMTDYDFWRIESLIRKHTVDVLNSSGKDWERPYRAIIILLLALIELHKKRLMCLGSVPGRQNNVRESSIAALEMALNITRDITCMDDILSISKMPLAAVFLLQKAGTVAAWLEKHFNHMTEVLQPVTESLERASKRWIIASRISRELSAVGGISMNV